ncbi:unnamed protein product [Phyllotreta striolata]|uniref:Uncharacterized protein n=1 Tax=Phyllotreta striolata TaxID=444603 RepID=A0A9N9TP48_PHYSR|nr:unnamed protein product [Phyllotreta striolata]
MSTRQERFHSPTRQYMAPAQTQIDNVIHGTPQYHNSNQQYYPPQYNHQLDLSYDKTYYNVPNVPQNRFVMPDQSVPQYPNPNESYYPHHSSMKMECGSQSCRTNNCLMQNNQPQQQPNLQQAQPQPQYQDYNWYQTRNSPAGYQYVNPIQMQNNNASNMWHSQQNQTSLHQKGDITNAVIDNKRNVIFNNNPTSNRIQENIKSNTDAMAEVPDMLNKGSIGKKLVAPLLQIRRERSISPKPKKRFPTTIDRMN